MILCCGEALIDMIPMKGSDGDEGFNPMPGGSVFNTAIALGRLEVQVEMFTGLSTDMFGRKLDAALNASHVDTRKAVRSDRPTPLAFVQLTDGQASYTFYDERSTVRMLNTDDLPALDADTSAVYFGGISLCQNPVADALAKFCGSVSQKHVVVLDPNVRPGFVDDVDAYRRRLRKMIAASDIVKVSDEDLNWIFPAATSLDQKFDELLNHGVTVAILTRGHLGAKAQTSSGSVAMVPVPRVEVVDTVGAGDTFNAGFIARLSEMGLLQKAELKEISNATLEDCLNFAAKVSAINVSRAGANPPWLREVIEFGKPHTMPAS